MDVPSLRYDRVVLVATPVMIVVNYLIYLFFLACWRPKMSKDSIKVWAGKEATEMTPKAWTKFHKDSSGLVFGCAFHLWFGSAAFFATQGYLDNAPYRTLGDHGALMAMGDVEYIRLQESAAFLGSIFGALMLDYLFYCALGWDRDPAQIFHHVTFFCVTIVLARRSGMGESGLVAMAMEGSSPALNAMNIARQLDGPIAETLTLGLLAVFVLSFALLRGLMFGKAVVRVVFLRLASPDGFPMHVSGWEIDAVVLLWLAGWLLQLHWLRLIVLKIIRKLKKGDKKGDKKKD